MMIKKLLIAGALSSGLTVTAAGAAAASTSQHGTAARPAASHQVKATPEPAGENTDEQEGSTPGDGPGGHADPAGQNVDHQFTGVE